VSGGVFLRGNALSPLESFPLKRLSIPELKALYEEAKGRLSEGCVYKHTKSGNQYHLRGIIFIEATMEVHYTYSEVKEPLIVFSRPVGEFLEKFSPELL